MDQFILYYDGDGVQTVFTAPEVNEFISEIQVTVSGTPQFEGVDYTWDNVLQQVTFTVPPPSGTENVEIFRFTSTSEPKVVYQKDGVLTEQDINISLQQIISRINEMTEFEYLQITDGHFYFDDRQLKDVSDPTDPQDVLTLNYFLNNSGSSIDNTVLNGILEGDLPIVLAEDGAKLDIRFEPQVGGLNQNPVLVNSGGIWRSCTWQDFLDGIVDLANGTIVRNGNRLETAGFTGARTVVTDNDYSTSTHELRKRTSLETWQNGLLVSSVDQGWTVINTAVAES